MSNSSRFLWNAASQASLAFFNSQNLLKFISTGSIMLFNHLILCHSLLPSSIFPSIRVFSSELTLRIRWPKYWSFSISPSSEYSGLISLGLTGVISLLTKGCSRVLSSTTFRRHQFFWAQPSLCSKYHIHTWLLRKTYLWHLLAKWCLCFLICCLSHNFSSRGQASFNFMAAVTICSNFGAHPPSPNRICHCFHFSPIYLPWSDETGCHDLSFLNVEL